MGAKVIVLNKKVATLRINQAAYAT
jgi:hypothetical protein